MGVPGLLLTGGLAAASAAEPSDQTAGTIDFQRDVQPLLAARCLECHGPEKREGGLRFTSRDDALLPADSNTAVIAPGDSAASELIRRVTEAVVAALDVQPEQVRVLLAEVPPEHWGIGGTTAAERNGAAQVERTE